MEKQNFAIVYFIILGIVSLSFGIMDFAATVGHLDLAWGIIEIPNDGFRGGWGGLVIIFAGVFYLLGVKNIKEIHQVAKLIIGSILIWIIAATDIFAMFTESIPGGEGGPWFNTLEGFLETYTPPYPPAIFLLPFSLVTIFYMVKSARASG